MFIGDGVRDRVGRAAHRPGRDRRAAAAIGEGVALRDTIVWPGTQVDAGHRADRRGRRRPSAGRQAQRLAPRPADFSPDQGIELSAALAR